MIPEHITRIFTVQYIPAVSDEPGFWFVRSSDHAMTQVQRRKLREAGFRKGWFSITGPPLIAGWQKLNKGENDAE